MKIFFQFIATAIYFFIIIMAMNVFFSKEKLLYYIVTIPLLAAGALVIDFIINKLKRKA